MKRQLTSLQRATLFAHVHKAASEQGVDPEKYRKMIMREELGVDHLSEVSRTDGFDRLMCRMLKDCGDYSHALDYVGGDVKRLRHLALSAAAKICDGAPFDVERMLCRYVAGVMINMKYSSLDRDALAMRLQRDDGWDDFTPMQLKKVVAALNLQVRRRR